MYIYYVDEKQLGGVTDGREGMHNCKHNRTCALHCGDDAVLQPPQHGAPSRIEGAKRDIIIWAATGPVSIRNSGNRDHDTGVCFFSVSEEVYNYILFRWTFIPFFHLITNYYNRKEHFIIIRQYHWFYNDNIIYKRAWKIKYLNVYLMLHACAWSTDLRFTLKNQRKNALLGAKHDGRDDRIRRPCTRSAHPHFIHIYRWHRFVWANFPIKPWRNSYRFATYL